MKRQVRDVRVMSGERMFEDVMPELRLNVVRMIQTPVPQVTLVPKED